MLSSLTRTQNRDPGIVKFQKTNLYYTTDKYLLYQDPTWLGFKLFFNFEQPDSKLLYSGTDGSLTSPPEEYKNTAYSYLLSIGEPERAEYLKQFVKHLQKINMETPWFFQTIEGLSDSWKRGYQDDAFKPLLPSDRKIIIGCLESIDLRMTSLMDLYRKACFDWKYRREVVPWNLRNFTVHIHVYEIRNINRSGKPSPSGLLDITKMLGLPEINEKQQNENKNLLGDDPFGDPLSDQIKNIKSSSASIGGKDSITGIKNILGSESLANESSNTINPNISQVHYKFSYCEWLPDESSEVMTKVSSRSGGEGEAAQQKIAFSYRDVEEVNLYNIYSNMEVKDNVERVFANTAFDYPELSSISYGPIDIANPKFNQLLPFASLGAQRLERFLNSQAGKLFMGNVYGFSALRTLDAASGIASGDPVNVVRGAETITNNIQNVISTNRSRDVTNGELGNVYVDRNPA